MANSRPDYVHVQLTPEGVAFAGGVPLRISGTKRSFLFEGDTPQEVEKSAEWRGILMRQTTADGTALVQLVSAPAAATTSAAAPAATAPAPAAIAASTPEPAATSAAAAPAPAAAAEAPAAPAKAAAATK